MELSVVEHVQIPASGVSLHAVVAGPTDGPLVILLHGFPEFWYGWRHQIEPLAEAGFRVVVPDMRGYNTSGQGESVADYHLDRLADDVLALVEWAGRDQCQLVGHDWGGVVAWYAASRDPEWISKLAVLNIPHPVVMKEFLSSRPSQMLKSWYIGLFQVPGVEKLLGLADGWALAAMLRSASKAGSFTDEDIATYREAWRRPGCLRGMLGYYRAALRARPTEPSDVRIRVPTLLIWGRHDVALSHEMAEPSVALCDEGRLEMVPSAGHFVQHDEPGIVNQLLLEFLATDSPGGGR